ncbi:uncharacterized protein LOC106012243 [Aplysia californica]|uniref:Uncharacterized protein LOC106012243 n=1 Tax=Aplysia californica TaxID=6500 RepID=A0ABM1A3F4_APLCA|nr:uncharacterized protein LOC106012243 [Aplysia californica]
MEATRDGGGVIYIKWLDETSSSISIPTGKYSTNYNAETEALQEATKMLGNSEATHKAKVVLLTVAKLSVPQFLENSKSTELNALTRTIKALNSTACSCLEWIPGHVDIFGNECADELEKKGGQMEQTHHSPDYQEAKTLIKSAIHAQWNEAHSQRGGGDLIYQLPRANQVIIFRLRTRHN